MLNGILFRLIFKIQQSARLIEDGLRNHLGTHGDDFEGRFAGSLFVLADIGLRLQRLL
jgi:hypothetical protein